jgi:transposase
MPTTLYKKLGLSKQELITKVHQLYWNQNLSQKKIANVLNCNITTIERMFASKFILPRTLSQSARIVKKRNLNISEEQIEILNGLLLSDFHIEKGAFQARLSFGFKYKEFSEYCIKKLNCFQWSELKQDKKTGAWHAKTAFYKDLFILKTLWYNKKKRVPKDLKITPLTLLFWYLGDGQKVDYGALLCSESFCRKDNIRLSRQLDQLQIKNKVTPNNRIRICGKEGFLALMNTIGECPIKCYTYKFL